jgi:hypothetical protein
MKTIQTSYALAATLREALAVAEQAAEAGEEEACRASPVDPPEECSPAKVAAGTAPSRKETRNQRRAKRRKFQAEASGGVQKTAKRVAQRRAFRMVEEQSLTVTTAAKEDLKAAEGGWLGSRKNVAPEEESTLQELLDSGLKLVQWDGM